MYTSPDEITERIFVQGSSISDITLFTVTSICYIILKKKKRSFRLQWKELRKFLKLHRSHDITNRNYNQSYCNKRSILIENETFPWEPEIENPFEPTSRSGNDGEILLCTFITKEETSTQEIKLTNEEKMKEAKELLQYKGTFHVSCPCCK
jgi:hypothetical protein